MEEYLLERFHGNGLDNVNKGEFDGHFWLGYGSFGRGLRAGCDCTICRHGWETARKAYATVAKGYRDGERHHRQLTLFKLD